MSVVHFGDCREVMRKLIADGEKVQMCVTSPPYFGLRDYGVEGQLGLEDSLGEFIANMVQVFDLVHQLLADDGTCWVNMGDSYASNHGSGTVSPGDKQATNSASLLDKARNPRASGLKPKDIMGVPWRLALALQDAGWYLRQDIIWHKPNPMPESATDRCTKAHEYVFLLSKSQRYFFDQDAIKEKASENTHPRRAAGYKTPDDWDTSKGEGGHGSFHRDGRGKGRTGYSHKRKLGDPAVAGKMNQSFEDAMSEVVEYRNKRSVWTVASEPYSGAHFATFPTALIAPCIMAGSRTGDTVLDPFFGSGTTGQVCNNLGREYIGIELNPEYKPLQDQRCAQPGLPL